MMRYFFFLLLLFGVIGSQVTWAQSSKNDTIAKRNVIIERNYTPTAPEVHRIESNPIVTEPEIKATSVSFSDQVNPLIPLFDLNKWKAAVVDINQDHFHNGYAIIGGGFYGNLLGDLFLPIVHVATQKLTFNTHVTSLFGNKQQQLVTHFGLDYTHYFHPLTLHLGGYFYRDGFNYYGTNGILTSDKNFRDSTNHFVNAGIVADLHSNRGVTPVQYSASVQFNSFVPGFGLHEQLLRGQGNIEIPLNENQLGLSVDLSNYAYNNHLPGFGYANYAVIAVNPYFNLMGDSWKVHIGFKDAVTTAGSNKRVNVMPDVTAQIHLIPSVMLYGGVSGEYHVNDMATMMNDNPYLVPSLRVKDTYVPVDAFLGIKSTPISGLLLNGSIDYKYFNQQFFYVNALDSTSLPAFAISHRNVPMFNVMYDKAQEATVNFSGHYSWKDEQVIFIEANYHYWHTQSIAHAWMNPSFELSAGIDKKVSQHVVLNADYYFAGGRYALQPDGTSVLMRNINQINLGASYSYSDFLTAFVHLNNVLGLSSSLRYQNWYGYDALGVNFQIGVALSF
ncbi:MAG: hypothetical protein ACP5F6_00745 [Microbacter sp.]